MPDDPPSPKLEEEILAITEKEETELDKVLDLLMDPRNIEHNTELSRNEITAFSVLHSIAEKYNLAILDQFLRKNLILRVSKGRAGRKEWVKIISAARQHQDEQDEKEVGRFRRMFGRR